LLFLALSQVISALQHQTYGKEASGVFPRSCHLTFLRSSKRSKLKDTSDLLSTATKSSLLKLISCTSLHNQASSSTKLDCCNAYTQCNKQHQPLHLMATLFLVVFLVITLRIVPRRRIFNLEAAGTTSSFGSLLSRSSLLLAVDPNCRLVLRIPARMSTAATVELVEQRVIRDL